MNKESSVSGNAEIKRVWSDVESGRNLSTEMFAVVQEKRKGPFELRSIEVLSSSEMKEFDRSVFETAYSEYLSEDLRYVSLEESLDVKDTVAIIDAETQKTDNKKDNQEESLLDQFVGAAMASSEAFANGDIQSLDSSDFQSIKGLLFVYLIELGGRCEKVYAYQKIPPSAALRETNIIEKIVDQAKFKLFAGESIRVARYFDFIIINKVVYALRPKTLVGQFGFGEILQERAGKVVSNIDHLISGCDLIVDRVAKDRKRTINKLIKIQSLSVIKMSAGQLRKKLEGTNEYAGKFRFDKNDHIVVKSPQDIDAVLSMLNDEIVVSPLTGDTYSSEIKEVFTQ